MRIRSFTCVPQHTHRSFSVNDFHENRHCSTAFCSHVLHRISPPSKNKCRKYWYKCINSRTKVQMALCGFSQSLIKLLYAFFWVITRRLNFICWGFGTLCLFHLHRPMISNFRRVLNVVCFLLGYSPASELYMPTFRNTSIFIGLWFQTFAMFWMLYAFFWVIPRRLNFICRRFGTFYLFYLHRRIGMKYHFILHTSTSYLPAHEDGRQSIPKRRRIKFRRRRITQKKAYNIQFTTKVWNQESH